MFMHRHLLTLPSFILAGGLLAIGAAEADPPKAYERPNIAYTFEPTNPYSGRTDLQIRRPFSYGSTRRPSSMEHTNSPNGHPLTGSLAPRNQSGIGVRNSPGIGIQGTSGGAVRNNPGIAVRNNPGIAVRNNPGIAVRNTPSSDAYTEHPDVLETLPREHRRIRHRGRTWYHVGHRYFQPVYHGGGIYYVECYPPVGYVIDTLPDFAQTIVVDNTTYHTVNNAWYVPADHDGRSGYQVVPPPGTDNQQPDQPAVTTPPDTPPADEAPDPFQRARIMSDFLADQRGFTLVASDVYETHNDQGDPIRHTNRRTFNLARPHRLIADIRGNDGNLRAYYDGRNLAIHHRDAGAYSTLPMPSTIDAMLEDLDHRFDLTIPLADLLYDDVYEAVIGRAEHAQYLGIDRVGPAETHHLLFWNDDIDWELWIDTGEQPLPRKITIIYKTLPGAPRYTATIRKWQLNPDFPPEHFRFRRPQDAEEVEIQPVRDPAGSSPHDEITTTQPATTP